MKPSVPKKRALPTLGACGPSKMCIRDRLNIVTIVSTGRLDIELSNKEPEEEESCQEKGGEQDKVRKQIKLLGACLLYTSVFDIEFLRTLLSKQNWRAVC